MSEDPFEKYKAELASVGLKSIDGSISYLLNDRIHSINPQWVGPIHKFKYFRKHTKNVDRIVRCHERNGAKVLLVTNSYFIPTKVVHDPETGRHRRVQDTSKPIEDQIRVLFAGRGRIVCDLFLGHTDQTLSFDHVRYTLNEFFSLSPDVQDETIEPDPFVRMVAQTARQM